MRIVLDTNVLVRANVQAQGPARRLLLKIAHSDQHSLILSPFLLRETERCLSYPRLRSLWELTEHDIREHVEFLERISELVHPGAERPLALKDPNDDPVLYTAVAAKADVLCTWDRHFYEAEVISFCAERGIRVLSDVELVTELD